MLFFVEVVVVLMFCRHLTFELVVVVCVRAGLEKKRGVEAVRSPPRGGVGGGGAPPFAKK